MATRPAIFKWRQTEMIRGISRCDTLADCVMARSCLMVQSRVKCVKYFALYERNSARDMPVEGPGIPARIECDCGRFDRIEGAARTSRDVVGHRSHLSPPSKKTREAPSLKVAPSSDRQLWPNGHLEQIPAVRQGGGDSSRYSRPSCSVPPCLLGLPAGFFRSIRRAPPRS